MQTKCYMRKIILFLLSFAFVGCATTTISSKNNEAAAKEAYVIQAKVIDALEEGNSNAAAVLVYQREAIDSVSADLDELVKSIEIEKAKAYAQGKADGYKEAIEDVKSVSAKTEVAE